jgi:transposase
MEPITKRDREIIVKHKQNKEKNENIAKWLFVSVSSITRIWKLFKETGDLEPKTGNAGRKPILSEEELQEIEKAIENQPDITLLEMIDKFNLDITESGLSKVLKKRGFSFKKRLSIQKNKKEQM